VEGFNIWAVLAAAASAFLLGGLWYSPFLFLKPWTRANGSEGKPQGEGHPARVFGVSFAFALLAAFVFAVLLGPKPPLDFALARGLMVGGGLVAACFGINYQFSNRPTLLWLIDGGYHVAQFLLYGLILGLWH
jgi:Protein of unknown function (DUF1761)